MLLSALQRGTHVLRSNKTTKVSQILRSRSHFLKPFIVATARSMSQDISHGEHKPNRLAKEESPYLLQHQYNPVDWYSWNEEAFEQARSRDVPIFLSIGYSTCHWCHVMERESFENEDIATLLNENFVSIKVDKEERPDVDRLYMTYVQATQGGGGWPMSVFLTPDLAPFFGGTYFPPEDAFGRPGFPTVLRRIAEVWQQRKAAIRESSRDALQQLAELVSTAGAAPEKDAEAASVQAPRERDAAIDACANALARRFDARQGGFGGAPKFPRPSELLLLMTQYVRQVAAGQRDEARRTLHMATFTLDKMADGGMRDQLGGGFHRYSVDELWHVPHFEIMLYDQPQLVNAYLTAFQITKQSRHAMVARGVLDYLMRDLRHPDGAFFAAEDADSLDPADGQKKEGHFYVWTQKEVDKILDTDLAGIFKATYGVKPNGNCTMSPRSDPHDEFKGKNVLIRIQDAEAVAGALHSSLGQGEEALAACREELFGARCKRPRPHRDEKIVAAWNGMAIGAFALAGRALMAEDPPIERLFPVEGRDPREYIAVAERAAQDVKTKLYDEKTNRLRRAFTKGPSAVAGFSDDYVMLISGLLDLYSATGAVQHLEWAMQLQQALDEDFWDETAGGYFQAAAGDSTIQIRMKEDYDGAEVAASSVAVTNLWRLAALSGTHRAHELRQKAEKCAGAFTGRLKEAAIAMPQMCCGLHLLSVGHARQVIVAGQRGSPDTEALLNASFASYTPDKAIIHIDLSDEVSLAFWRKHNIEALAMAEGSGMEASDPATCFVCYNFTCRSPTTDPAAVVRLLSEPRGSVAAEKAPVKFTLPGSEA